ncbi:GrpB family protein [Streptomyces maoxianensis]|uniref:GrpB family protein n=1 Tax=Streptomyces maoxianensis TaxID=1459942 RepID=A0ABV9G2J1_9ACTN
MPAAEDPEGNEPVHIHDYDPSWPVKFEAERAALQDCIGPWVVGDIHHVGSTAVPGLPAKPIIDILVGVDSLDYSRLCIQRVASLDYLYWPYRSNVMHWFCKPHPARRTHHLHLVPMGSRRYLDELAFRDALRAEPGLAARYAALKRDLAARFRSDREAYTEHKAPFVKGVLATFSDRT